VFRDPNQMVLAVPDRVTAALIILHSSRIASRSPNGEGFTDPLIGDFKFILGHNLASGIFPRLGKMLYLAFETFVVEPSHATSA
ncbi:MAG: hypothetical protein WBE80_16385, partial [Methylocella sp.]